MRAFMRAMHYREMLMAHSCTILLALFVFGFASAARGDELPVDLSQISTFGIDFTGGNVRGSTGPWFSISGGDQHIEVVEQRNAPGQAYYSDITVRGPFVTDRKAVMDWVNATAQGKHDRRHMTLTLFGDDNQPERTFVLYNCLPIRYQPPAVSSDNSELLEESLTFSVTRIRELDRGVRDRAAEPVGDMLLGGRFSVDIEGDDVDATSLSGGGVGFDKNALNEDARGGFRQYTITKADWENIVIERNYDGTDTRWEEWASNSQPELPDLKHVTLAYKDSDGATKRKIDFASCYPIRYEVIDVDSRSGSSSIEEVLELVCERAVYR